jgi:hypothetical protein
MTPDPSPTYRVIWSSNARNALKQMSSRALIAKRMVLGDLLASLNKDLSEHPEDLGEVYKTRGPISEYHYVRDFLSIDYAIDSLHRLVNVRKCDALSGHGLD